MKKIFISILLTLGGMAVFVLGSPYYRIFPTNNNQTYYIGMAVFFLVTALIFKKSKSFSPYAGAAYALFIASSTLVFLKTGILNLPSIPSNPLKDIAYDKLSQFLHIVPVIIGLTLIARQDLKSIFIRKGRLKQGLIFGVVSFVCFAGALLATQSDLKAFLTTLPDAIPWMLLFIFANAIMEELWFRGIFLKHYEKIIGRKAAILVTALVFGVSHINATYDFPGGGLVFGLVVFGLGVVGAYAMSKDDSLIGPVLFHAGYDLLVIMPVLNSL